MTSKEVFVYNLDTAAHAFQLFVNSAVPRLLHLQSIRVDDAVTAIAIDTERAALLKEVAFASLVVENLKALSETAATILP